MLITIQKVFQKKAVIQKKISSNIIDIILNSVDKLYEMEYSKGIVESIIYAINFIMRFVVSYTLILLYMFAEYSFGISKKIAMILAIIDLFN